ncbi:hypothetical protein [uncultured Desulfuromusa sp.]|uniref:hypothetical protein n=1 Tax=uncultured Desulfuromusa sp. TaxID=219183 RepID=UPI002AA6392C|nr:hypothetical protein [uncultured Desulfuromusa sp.]
MNKLHVFMALVFILFVTSCAFFTGGIDVVERDAFLYKLPQMNEQILGNLKYDDPTLDLRTLSLDKYGELANQIEHTDDNDKTIKFIEKSSADEKFVVLKDTFLVCVRSDKWEYLLCDDAATRGADDVKVDRHLPSLETAFQKLLNSRL